MRGTRLLIGPVVTKPSSELDVRPAATARIPALDGLRGIAILLVLLWHGMFGPLFDTRVATYVISVGRLFWSGVDLFFVLSGFLIGGILLDSKDSPRYFATFYLRRAYRILPVYGAVVAFYYLKHIPAYFLHGSPDQARIPFLAYAMFTQNFWMALGISGGIGLAATWSLAVEEQFYLTAPLIVRRLNRVRLAYVLSAVVVLSPLLRVLVVYGSHLGKRAPYVLMPCRADALCRECCRRY